MEEKKENIIAKEYRLIPLERDEDSQGDWNINDLLKQLWEHRNVVIISVAIVFFIGIVIAITKPYEYEASTTLLIETQSQSVAENLLQNYGGLLGLSGNLGGQTGDINSDLYPDILNSMPFQLELIEQELTFTEYDTTASIYTFFTQIYNPSFYHYLKRYTVGLNSIEAQFFRKSNDPLDYSWKNRGVLNLPSSQKAIARGMSEYVEVTVSDGKVEIEAWLPDPHATSELVDVVKNLLAKYLTDHQTEKAMKDLEFIENQYAKAKERFRGAQEDLAKFRDENRNLVTAQAQTQEQRLQSEYDIAFNIYNSFAQRMEQAKVSVQEETPVFSTLEPALVPTSPSSPKRILILILSIFLGFFLGVLVTGGYKVATNLIEKFKSL